MPDPKPYRQRNTSGYPLDVPEIGRRFGPDEEVEHPNPICGFTAVTDLDDDKPTAKTTDKPKSAAKRTASQDEEDAR